MYWTIDVGAELQLRTEQPLCKSSRSEVQNEQDVREEANTQNMKIFAFNLFLLLRTQRFSTFVTANTMAKSPRRSVKSYPVIEALSVKGTKTYSLNEKEAYTFTSLDCLQRRTLLHFRVRSIRCLSSTAYQEFLAARQPGVNPMFMSSHECCGRDISPSVCLYRLLAILYASWARDAA